MPEFLPFVRRWFTDAFAEATRPQREGWEAIASGRDTLIVAPTGSGKTLAAFLWALDHLHRLGAEGRLEDRVYVVYVSPLRALNNDIEKNLREPLAGIRAAAAADGLTLPEVRVAVRTGDTLAAARQAMTRRPPHVLITTPESLYILLTSQGFRPALAQTRFVIVDEVHAMLAGKRGAHLALTLERLQALVEAHTPGARPQRIGCSATVRPVEDALAFLTGSTAHDPIVIDAGFARDLDVQVVAPVDDFLTATSDTVWDATLQQIAEMVQAHRTTLVFAQSRRAAERLARDLNDRIPDGRVAAHHGSLSRRARLEAENRLKAGELRALVATSSLELGIDVGAIDLVVQVQSPRNVAAALQRVGRAGHLLSRTSKGRIVVTKGEELMEAAAVVRSIRAGQLDRVTMPEAPLDVLAQQIIAAVAAESLDIDTLHARFRNAAPYRALTRETFVHVVRAVSEPLPLEVRGAAPRVLWDRVNDRLHARRGSRFLALTAGGTIPDAGLYDVYVADTDLKVGTLDEEFVTESLPGDVFLLGSHAWKIAKVKADRVLVEDAHGMSPTIPFWKGEHPSRSWDLGVAVGRLRRDAADRLDTPDFAEWSARECGCDARAAAAMHAWLVKAGEVLQGVPDDQGIVVESFSDEMGGRHAMIHSVFGMRINGAWGMALREQVRRRFGLLAEASHVDDGILLSFAPGQVPPSPERLVTLVGPEDLDPLLGEALIGSPLFGTRFRHCAIRALFIPRMTRGQRTPAYLQRLKADALLESVRGQPDFPVVAETLRECFNDAYDVPRLKRLLERLQDRELWVRHVDTPLPSPFVYPLLLAWDWAYLDAGHAEERRADAVVMRKSWSVAAGPLRPEIVAAVEAELQKTAAERRARDANELAALLDDLGDLSDAEIAERVTADPEGLVAALLAERRIAPVEFSGGRRAWIPATDATLYAGLATDAGIERLALRVVRTRGPRHRRVAGRALRGAGERDGRRARSPGGSRRRAPRAVSGGGVGGRAVRARGGARRDPATAGSRAPPAAARGDRRAVLARSCSAVTICTPSTAWSARPASWPRWSCCRATMSRFACGSRISCPRAWRTTGASGSIASASAARSCGRSSSLRAASGRGGASGSRSGTTSAGCARPASVPRSMRGPRTCCCTCSCAAPRSRAISRDRPVWTRRGPWPRCGSCSGRVWRRPTRSARSWPPGRRRAAAASARRVGADRVGARRVASSRTSLPSGAGARSPRRSRSRPRSARKRAPSCCWPATAWWRASWRAATGPRSATRCCGWSTAATSCAATSSRGSPASSMRCRRRLPTWPRRLRAAPSRTCS